MTSALTRQARIDARTLELIEEAPRIREDMDRAPDSVFRAATDVAPCSVSGTANILRAALTEARRIATEEADATP